MKDEADLLVWHEDLGYGYFPVHGNPYDRNYFQKYQGYAATKMGKALTEARVDLVDRHLEKKVPVVDIGIGCGHFIIQRDRGYTSTTGYDVNPYAIRWLLDRKSVV